MKSINEYLNSNSELQIDESMKLPSNKLNIIQDFLNNKERFDFDNEIECSFLNNGKELVSKEILADIAGYMVEAYIWSQLSKIITSKEFSDEWLSANNGKTGKDFKLTPLSRRNGDGVYWDFEIDGIDEKFEIKSRMTGANGKAAGGYRFTANQTDDKNLIYILVKYSINENKIVIGDIKVTRHK